MRCGQCTFRSKNNEDLVTLVTKILTLTCATCFDNVVWAREAHPVCKKVLIFPKRLRTINMSMSLHHYKCVAPCLANVLQKG